MSSPFAARIAILTLVGLASVPAAAFTGGTPPALMAQESVFGDAAAHADTLMINDGTVNDGLRPGGGFATLDDIPADGETVRAFVFWAGSVDPIFGVDRDIDLTLPSGAFFNDLSVDVPEPGETLSPVNRCVTLTVAGSPFYSCRREITDLVAALGPGGANGTYNVDDVDAKPGDCMVEPTTCQAMFAGFSVVVFWESPQETVRRELVLHDAFFAADERNLPGFSSGISPPFLLDGFTVGDAAEVRLTYFGFEGDQQLGNPPQDLLDINSPRYCPSCPDFVEVSSSGGTARLSGPGNPEGNLFNSTIAGQPPTPGVDLDTFDLGPAGLGVLNPGDTDLTLVVGSGDGVPGNGDPNSFPDQGGSGELVILGMTLLTLDTPSPRLQGNDTSKAVLEAVAPPGGTLNYTLRVENDGSTAAPNVRVLDTLPAGVSYDPGSTTNTCGVNSDDVGGTSPALTGTGLNIGTLVVGEECEVRFRAVVDAGTPDGTVLENFFTVSADNHPEVQIGPAVTVVESPDLAQPTKTVEVLGGGDPVPGAPLIYTIRIANNGSQPAIGLSVQDTLPAEVEFVSMISTPPGSTDNSGGGDIDVEDITVGAGSFAEVVFAAEIRPGTAPGTVIENQATVDGPGLMAPLLTDDPSQPGGQDPTTLTVISSINLSTSSKSVLDVNGPLLVPGDTLEYTLTIAQSGTQAVTVSIVDDLPAFVTGCNVVGPIPNGFAVCTPGGANGTGQVQGTVTLAAGSSVDVVIQVSVDPAAPDGAIIQNAAELTPLSDPAQAVTVNSPALEVFARPVFTTSAKAVQDLDGGDVRPGDVLRYSIVVENSGPVGATSAEVVDPVDPNLVVTTVGQGGAFAGGEVTWPIGALASGANTTLTFEAEVPAGTADGTVITNVATVSADPPADGFTTAAVTVTVVAEPDLVMTKAVADLNGAPFEPADTVRYAIELQNNGDGAADDVEVRDPLDPSFASVTFPGGGRQEGAEVVFDAATHPALASLAPGASITLLFDATLDTPLIDGTQVQNQAFATAEQILTPLPSDGDPGGGPDDPTVFNVTSQAELVLQKTFVDENGGALMPGDRVEFALTLENVGNAPARDVEVTDPLDVRLAFVDSASGGTLAGTEVRFDETTTPSLASVVPGAPVTLLFRADIAFPLPDGTTIENQAAARSTDAPTVDSDDPTTPAPLDPTALVVESRPVLDEFEKAVIDLDGDGVFEPGDRVRYELSVTNTGTENAFNLEATDPVPAGLTNVVPGNGGQLAGGQITWTGATTPGLAGLAPGNTASFAFEADIVRPLDDLFVIANQATIEADGVTPVPSDDPATAAGDDPTSFEVRSFPELVVEKRVTDVNGQPVEPGDRLAYEIRVRNEGDRAAVDLSVDDPLDPSLTNVAPLDGGAVIGGAVQWDQGGNPGLANLAIDTELVLRFEADVVSPLANGTFVDNQATVSTGEAGVPGAPWPSDDPTTPDPLDPTRVQIVSEANLAGSTLESFDEGGAVITTARPDDLITYVLVVRNSGNAAGTDVEVTVPFPANLSPESAAGGTIAGGTVTFTSAGSPGLASVAPGDEVTLVMEARVAFPLADGTLLDVQGALDADGLVNPFVTDDPSTGAPSDPTRVTVVSSAELGGSPKTFLDIEGGDPEPGDLIQYRIEVTNTGDAVANGVTVTDPLPPQVEFVSSSSGGVLQGGNVVFTSATTGSLAAVAPGTPAVLLFTVRILPGVDEGTEVANQAQLQAGAGPVALTDDPATAAAPDPTRFTVVTVPELTFTKAFASPAGRVLAPGDPLTYTFTILSSGSETVQAGTLTDTLPEVLTGVAVSGPGDYDPGTRTLSATLPGLAPGAQIVITVNATVAEDAPNGTQLINQATITVPELGEVLSDDPDTPPPDDATVAVVEAFPDLTTSTKVATDENGGSLLPGDVVRYVITVANTGNGQAQEVQVTDAIDTAQLEIVEVEDGGAAAGGTVVWSQEGTPALTEIEGGAEVELAVRVRVRTSVEDGAQIDNQASIQARDAPAVPTDDPDTAAVDDPTRVTVQAPVISMTKTLTDANGAPVNPGDEITYTMQIENSGTGAASDVVVTDLIPIRLTEPEAPGATIEDGLATWDLGTLAAGATETLTLSGTVNPLALGGETLANQAELNAAEILVPIVSDDPTTGPSPDATIRTIEGMESYEGTVELLDPDTGLPIVSAVVPGQRVAVRVTVQHTGTQAGQAVTVRIPFVPSQFLLNESPDGVVSPDGTAMRWTASTRPALEVVLPGTELVFEATGTIQSPIPDGLTIPVEARVTSAVSQGQEWVIGPATMEVNSKPDLSASTKTVTDENGGVPEPGDLLTYRITVINAGGAEAADVRVIDPAPPGTVYVPGSATLAGVPVPDDGQNPFQSGLAIGDVGAQRSTVTTFQVRVDTSAVRGLEIANQAVLSAEGAPDEVSDNPATPLVIGDPTKVVVGGGPLLVAQKRASVAQVAPGDTLVFEIAVENGGSDIARDLVLRDEIAAPARYVPGTLRIDGNLVTDEADGDAGAFLESPAPTVEVRRDLLEAGEGFVISFEVEAEAGPSLTNQATVEGAGLAPIPTDADPGVPGAQALVVPVSGGQQGIIVDDEATELRDGDGGLLEAGDPVWSTTVVRNQSLVPIRMTDATFNVSALLDVEAAELEAGLEYDEAARAVRLANGSEVELEPGASVSFRFPATVSEDAPSGDAVRVVAEGVFELVDGGQVLTTPLGADQLTVGLLEGAGALSGVVYFDGEDRNGQFDLTEDERAVGFQVLAFRAGVESDEPTRTATTDDRGRYQLTPLPAGAYRIVVRSATGATFLRTDPPPLEDGEVRSEDLRIDPSGVVYRSGTFQPVRGARVFLYVDDGNEELGDDALVPEEDLLPGQQGQVTPRQGLYRFDPPPGDYRLGVEPADELLSFPSTAIEPNRQGADGHPLGAVADPAADGRVVAHAVPDPALDSTYYLRFSLSPDEPPVLNNHVPLDSLRDSLRITKTANRKRLSIGDLVAYTVRVENPSGGEVLLADGGVEIVDALPAGFRLVDGGWRLDRIETDASGQQRRSIVPAVRGGGGRSLSFGAFALRANSAYELRYSVVVGPGARFGAAENRATLRVVNGAVPLTDTVTARVEVIPDPIFDLGTLRAKVFCDENADGWQDPGDLPLAGVRVYLDTGYYADADPSGKLHFTAIPPGMHLAKVDERTLPPGAELVGDPRENFYISAGLPAQISFPVKCAFVAENQPQITLNRAAWEIPTPATPTREVTIEGALPTQSIALGGVEMAVPDADLGLGLEGGEVGFGRAPGPNVPGLKDGVLRERLVFVPRAQAERKVLAWKVTVQRERPAAGGSDPAAVGAPVEAGADQAQEGDPEREPASGVDGGVSDAGPGADGGSRQQELMDRRAAAVLARAADVDGGVVAGAAPAGVEGVEPAGEVDGGRTDLPPGEGPSWDVEPVYVFAGEGALPKRIVWDGKDEAGQQLLEAGGRYGAVLSLVVDGGDEGFSASRPFGVAFGEPAEPVAEQSPGFETTLDAIGGPVFDPADAPTERTQAWLDELAPRLAEGEGQVEVRVHVDAQPEGAAATALTARRAQAIAAALVERGVAEERIDAQGEGDGKPVKPNLRSRDRKANRRVEIRLVAKEPSWPAVTPLSWPAEVEVNGELVALEAGADTFSVTRELELGSALAVTVRGRGLGSGRVTRVVDEGPFDPAPGSGGEGEETTLLDGDLAAGTVLWGAREAKLDLLGARLIPTAKTREGQALMTVPGGQANLALKPVTGTEERNWAEWTVRIMKPLPTPEQTGGDESEEPAADAPPPVDGGVSMEAIADGGAVGPAGAEAEAEEAPEPPERPMRLIRELSGEGAPPEEVRWDGKTAGGVFVPSVGETYVARLILEAEGGDVAISPDLEIFVGTDKARAVESRELATLADPATEQGTLKPAARQELQKLAEALPESGTLEVVAHENRGSRLTHRTQSQKVADAVKAELVDRGVDAERIISLGAGSDQPIVPGVNSRARRKNRRVTISLEVPSAQPAAGDADAPVKVLANGRPLELTESGFTGEVPASTSGEVALILRTASGARAVMRLRPETLAMWEGRPAAVDAALAEEIARREAALHEAIFAPEAEPDAGPAPATEQPAVEQPANDGGAPQVVDGGAGPAQPDAGRRLDVDAGRGPAAEPDAGPPADVDAGPAPAAEPDPFYVDGAVPWTEDGPAPGWWPSRADVPAARLHVVLPKDGELMTTDRFLVRGRTDPRNRILVGGTEVEVDPETGAFEHLYPLVKGRNEMVVEAIDPMGNRGRIRRLIQVDTDGWFFLMLADGAFGMNGAMLDERSASTSLTLPFDTFVYGRGVAYVKGQLQSPYVFKDLDLTLHIDTRRWAEDAFVRNIFDPELLYPVYGDSSVEVQDAVASYPLYLRLKADHSSILIGNVRTELAGGDLFRFHRTRYGAAVHFDRGWSNGLGIEIDPEEPVLAPQHDPWRTQVKAFVSGGADATRHARVELWGTGSSIYFLRHEDVIEGSERVFLIVRDAITGTEIARSARVRNRDYTIRYPEGRIVFKEPIPAFADTAFLTNMNLGQVRSGHRVYVEVEYDHDAQEPFQAWAAGGQFKQVLFGHAEIGAGYAYEGRYDVPLADGYHLAGAHAKLWWDEGTYVKGELAWSRSIDQGNFYSLDGGLTYNSLGQSLDEDPVRQGRVVFPAQRQGWAAKLEAQALLGEWVGRKDRDAMVRAYFQRQSPGFFAGASIVEQGQWKGGGEGRWQITDDDLLQLRADYVWSEIPEIPHVTEVRNLHRALATLRYQRRLPWGLLASAEYGTGLTYDTATFGQSNIANPFLYLTNIGAAGVDWQLLENLSLGLKQEVIFTGDGTFVGADLLGMEGTGRHLQTWNDHFVTHLTARYNLSDDLALTGTESVRWNGENATSLGMSWQVNDSSRIYANERLGFTRQGMTTTTVIGGETQPTEGSRTYGEYQLTSGFAGEQARGVAGIVNRVKLPFGFALNFGYERVQVLGGDVTPTAQGAVPPGAFTDGTFYAAPGANAGGDYVYGAGSRDAASLGLEYKRGNVLFSQRLELRYDNFDEDRGGHDRVWGMSRTNFNWVITPELSVLARYNVALAYDLNLATRETHLEDGSFGVSYRPLTHDWISVWAKLSRRVEVRPLSLKEGRLDAYMAHVAAVEPIVELPWKFQLVLKGAFKHASQAIDDLDPVQAYTALGIGRVNWHALGTIRSLGIDPYVPGDLDLGVEYRALWGITSATVEHGFLVEAQYAPLPYFRIGVGWNFTRFSDNLLLRNDQDHSGFFVRAVGQY